MSLLRIQQSTEDLRQLDRFGPGTMEIESFNNPFLAVNWNLGNVCTYKCIYCATACHDGSHGWPDIETATRVVRSLDKIYKCAPYNKRKIVFELLGGECTIWKDFEQLAHTIRETDNLIMLVTNGIRTARWWKDHAELFASVNLSFHPESADYQHISEVANILAERQIPASILLLMYPPRWEYSLQAHAHFLEHAPYATVSLQSLTLLKDSAAAQIHAGAENTNARWPYNIEQLRWMQENYTHFPRLIPKRDLRGIMCPDRPTYPGLIFFAHDNPSRLHQVTNGYLSSHRLNNWKDWQCYVGIDTLYLEQNGDLRRDAMCRVRKPFGNWKKDDLLNLKFPEQPVRCPYNDCFCSHDFKARKDRSVRGIPAEPG
ncbi:MAG TPA: radical SAM protein [Bdellovibrionales bacterium]|nr:radical SAM protein [Bdellovibrionales bacterium]